MFKENLDMGVGAVQGGRGTGSVYLKGVAMCDDDEFGSADTFVELKVSNVPGPLLTSALGGLGQRCGVPEGGLAAVVDVTARADGYYSVTWRWGI